MLFIFKYQIHTHPALLLAIILHQFKPTIDYMKTALKFITGNLFLSKFIWKLELIPIEVVGQPKHPCNDFTKRRL